MSVDNLTVFDFISKCYNTEYLTFECTVTTGFENVALEEFKEVFPNNENCKARGRIYFNIKNDVNDYNKILSLRSIDNIFIIASGYEDILFTHEKENDLQLIHKFAANHDFNTSLLFWKTVTHFCGITFPTKEEHDTVKDMLKIKKAEFKETDIRFNSNELDSQLLRYRVTCYRSQKHSFTSNDAAKVYGGVLNDKHNWIVDLDIFDLEIILNIVSNSVLVTFKLTKQSQHNRNIVHFGRTTLRPTICYSLLRLSKPQIGELLLDPMCGTGSITVESVLTFKTCFNLCGDIDESDIFTKCAGNINNIFDDLQNRENIIDNTAVLEPTLTENIDKAKPGFQKIIKPDVCVWDVTNLPFRDNLIDIIVSDLPFGKRVGNKVDNRILYRKLLLELARITLVKKGRAVLLTYDRRSMSTALKLTGTYWYCAQTYCVNIGGLAAAVYVLNRRKYFYKQAYNIDLEE